MKNKPLLRTSVPSTHDTSTSAGPDSEAGASSSALRDKSPTYSKVPKAVTPEARTESVSHRHPLRTNLLNESGGVRRLFEMCTPDGRALFTIERW